MRFRELVLEDFGMFGGLHRFDLGPQSNATDTDGTAGDATVASGTDADRPIILIGGKNGAGKTTFLDGLRLCLYGKLALGQRVTQSDYNSHLVSRIHRDGEGGPQASAAQLTLSFDYAEDGTVRIYTVTRRWEVARNGSTKVKETLAVERDGAPIPDLHESHWGDFIEDLIPFGVSQLFFFDGEKIKALAEDDTADAELALATKAMMGIDVVERLHGDLSMLRTRALRNQASGAIRSDLEAAEDLVAGLQAKVSNQEQRIAAVESEQLEASTKERFAKKDLARQGGTFAARRDTLDSDKAVVHARLEQLRADARRHIETALPLAFCPGVASRLMVQLDSEARARRARVLESHVDNLRDRLAAALVEDKTLDAQASVTLALLVERVLDGYLDEHNTDVTMVHDISEAAAARVALTLTEAAGSVSDRARQLATDIEDQTQKLRELERQLKLSPQDDVLKPVLDQLVSARTKLAGLDRRLVELKEELAGFDRELNSAKRDVERLHEKLATKSTQNRQMDLIERSMLATEEYRRRLTNAKLEQLQTRIAARFRSLARKDDLVHDVRVDPGTYRAALIDRQGRVLDRQMLSAGEKQIFAIALLWGLADVSGRPLPTVIDTPLGRLDSDHRNNLIQHYFPEVSHQVIILSTDTEVDRALYSDLSDSVSHAFRLDGAAGGNRTVVREGYFWANEGEA